MEKNIQITETNAQTVTTTYTLPGLSEGPSEGIMIGNIEMIELFLDSKEKTTDDGDMYASIHKMLLEIRNQLHLFEQYREVVEKTLIPIHNKLEALDPMGGAVIHLLEEMDHDGLIARKFFRELSEIKKKRDVAWAA